MTRPRPEALSFTGSRACRWAGVFIPVGSEQRPSVECTGQSRSESRSRQRSGRARVCCCTIELGGVNACACCENSRRLPRSRRRRRPRDQPGRGTDPTDPTARGALPRPARRRRPRLRRASSASCRTFTLEGTLYHRGRLRRGPHRADRSEAAQRSRGVGVSRMRGDLRSGRALAGPIEHRRRHASASSSTADGSARPARCARARRAWESCPEPRRQRPTRAARHLRRGLLRPLRLRVRQRQARARALRGPRARLAGVARASWSTSRLRPTPAATNPRYRSAWEANHGYFWFYSADNPEIFVKIVSACETPFARVWFFASGLTNLGRAHRGDGPLDRPDQDLHQSDRTAVRADPGHRWFSVYAFLRLRQRETSLRPQRLRRLDPHDPASGEQDR